MNPYKYASVPIEELTTILEKLYQLKYGNYLLFLEGPLSRKRILPNCSRPIRPQKLINLMRGARCMVFPSLYEGFGLPVLEEMSLGVPSLPLIPGRRRISLTTFSEFSILMFRLLLIFFKSDRAICRRIRPFVL
jgi:glycosyltransferase involved in cell wall biosynthesis